MRVFDVAIFVYCGPHIRQNIYLSFIYFQLKDWISDWGFERKNRVSRLARIWVWKTRLINGSFRDFLSLLNPMQCSRWDSLVLGAFITWKWSIKTMIKGMRSLFWRNSQFESEEKLILMEFFRIFDLRFLQNNPQTLTIFCSMHNYVFKIVKWNIDRRK